MSRRIDIVGHFGTTFSYATVASQVALQLMRAGRLGRVTNLDPAWHEEHTALCGHATAYLASHDQGSHVFVVTAPEDYLLAFPSVYGRERSGIFVSPNTDSFAPEHAQTCGAFGLAVAPSEWCADVVYRAFEKADVTTDVTIAPLGVDDRVEARRRQTIQALVERSGQRLRVLHLSTDQVWPGRKGTEELLAAWAILFGKEGSDTPAHLTVHVPPSLRGQALYRVRDLEIDESCDVVCGAEYGASPHQMFRDVDLVVAPSRCEGFGIMLLTSLVAGVPLLTTYVTGQRDFLRELPGWIGVPTDAPAPLVGEVGFAPTVHPHVLAAHLRYALGADVRHQMLEGLATDMEWHERTWWPASCSFCELLIEWLDRES